MEYQTTQDHQHDEFICSGTERGPGHGISGSWPKNGEADARALRINNVRLPDNTVLSPFHAQDLFSRAQAAPGIYAESTTPRPTASRGQGSVREIPQLRSYVSLPPMMPGFKHEELTDAPNTGLTRQSQPDLFNSIYPAHILANNNTPSFCSETLVQPRTYTGQTSQLETLMESQQNNQGCHDINHPKFYHGAYSNRTTGFELCNRPKENTALIIPYIQSTTIQYIIIINQI